MLRTRDGTGHDVRLPLRGVRVLELSSVFMAPYSAQVLSDWGADVVKVEPPEGDTVRAINQVEGNGLGPIFVTANRGKRSIVLDLKTDTGLEALYRLVRRSDVLMHNVRPAAAQRLGIDARSLRAINPELVHCAFRGYGDGGPYAELPAYDDVIQAATGVAAAQASDGSPPGYWRSAAADKIVGLYGAAAISAALHARAVSGVGSAIEVPMFETMASFMLLDRQGGWVAYPPNGPTGYARTDSRYRRPHRTSDGYLAVLIYTDRHWRRFFAAIGKDHLADDPRFSTIEGRTKAIDELYRLVEDELRIRSTEDCERLLLAADIPHGPVNSIDDLFADPHLSETQFFHVLEQPGLGPVRLARSPIDLGWPHVPPRPAPRLGEHTREVLEENGFGAPEVDGLLASGAVRQMASVSSAADPGEGGDRPRRPPAEIDSISRPL
ncbi:CoA transferase [Saccharomonospora sp. NPDC046836]|uniref:CaiB/BaiF CoA transferase family protein n=1 Tax=Saccharomonospora sp. NPDC046836 TaxID=3156921 RepID=UPI0033E1ACB1